MGRVKNRAFWESASMNNGTFMQYYNRLTELSISMFEWNNLPETVDERFLELALFSDGMCVFFEDETLIGNVQDVQDYGAAEVFFVKTHKGTEIMFPNVKDVIVSFDYKAKKLVLKKDRFKEVCDYED